MIHIPLKNAYALLEEASAVIVDDYALMYPALYELKDDPDNEFLLLAWEEDGKEYILHFTEEKNQTVKVSGTSLFLYEENSEGPDDHVQISLLKTQTLEK
jgi:hypothetical protein